MPTKKKEKDITKEIDTTTPEKNEVKVKSTSDATNKNKSKSTKFGSVHKNVDDPMNSINLLLTFTDENNKKLFSTKVVNALRSAGYNTLMQIASLPDQDTLKEVGGIGEKTAELISTTVAQHFGIDAQTAYSYEQRLRKFQLRCTTGSKALDTLLGGGIATKQITEFYGSPQMGKTQLCYSIAVHSILDESLGGFVNLKKVDPKARPRVFWVDTEFTFDPIRIRSLVKSKFPELNADEILGDIIITQPVTSDELIREVNKIFLSPDNIVTVIIDSLMAPFRSEALLSFSQLNPRQQKLQNLLGIIKRGMKVRNMAVILTNQVTTKINITGPGMGGPPQVTAAGGLAVAHTVTNRIFLKRATKAESKSRRDIEVRKAIVEDSPFLPDSSALFVLSDKGVIDFTTDLAKEVDKPLTGDSEEITTMKKETQEDLWEDVSS